MTTKVFTSTEIKDFKVSALARKYKCSDDYVRRILKGDHERNTELAKSIVKDAIDTLSIVERQTSVTV
jgi:Mor family transcriptional regulator